MTLLLARLAAVGIMVLVVTLGIIAHLPRVVPGKRPELTPSRRDVLADELLIMLEAGLGEDEVRWLNRERK